MATTEKGDDPKAQKLEMILMKGDNIISMLEKQGVATGDIKARMEDARRSYDSGEVVKAFKLAQQSIADLLKMKEDSSSQTKVPSPRGKGVFALIRDNTKEMSKKLDEWKMITKGWREKGYSFEEDKSLFSHSFEEIEKRFISIGGQIEKAEVIRGKIKQIRSDFKHVGQSYLKKVDEIEKATFRLDRLDDIERRLHSLASNLRSVEPRFTTLRNRIARFRRKELDTSSLDEMIENDEDLDYLDKQFNIYESNVDFLVKEKQKLNVFREEPLSKKFPKKIEEIQELIDNPWQLDRVVELMLSLEKDINNEKEQISRKAEEKTRKEEIKASMEKYREEGFKVTMVEQLLDEDINLLEEEYDIFIRQTAKLKSLREKLFKLDATGFEEEVSRISEKLSDPTSIETIEKELNELKDRILNQKVRSQKIENAIKEWTGMGFKVSKLEAALKKNINEADKIYENYKESILELSNYENRLQDIKNKDLEDMIHKVNLKIKNPELVEAVRKDMNYILQVVSDMDDLRGKRKELNGLLKVWKGQGYRIERILEMMREADTVKGLENIILQNTRAIATLESIKNDLPSEERGWFPKLEQSVREKMDDPEMSENVLENFTKLKKSNAQEEKRRGEISRKLKELSNRDIDISRIEPHLLGEKSLLDEKYKIFKEEVTKLLKLKAKLLKDAKRNKDQAKEMFAKSLNDPYSIEQYEAQLKGSSLKPGFTEKGSPVTTAASKGVNELRDLAKKEYKENRYKEALRLFDIILSMDPDHKESKFYKKKVLLKLKSSNGDHQDEERGTVKPVETVGTTEDGREEGNKRSPEGKADPNCLSCKGSGKCIWCNGDGKCSTCNGKGKSLGDTCKTCGGSGDCSVCKGTGKCSWCNI
ncbi:MAG: hypothetical protein ACMUHB_00840 [Thermoplasmatota archaeon]